MSHPNDRVFHRDIAQDYPVADHAEGVYIYDTEGRRFIDGTSSVFATSVGHGASDVIEAMAAQARRVAFPHTGTFTSVAEQQLAAKLVDLAPPGFEKAWFCTAGSEANETAIKLARQYHVLGGHPEKTKVISRWHSYHGSTLGALSLTGERRRREIYEPYLQNFPHIPPPYCYRCPLNLTYPSCEVACARELERAVNLVGPGYISAFIVEAVSGSPLGALTPPREYFSLIREICDRTGILMIVDEVITGMGRTGRMFGIEHWSVTPDVITLGKGLAGGYVPLGAVLVHQRVYRRFVEHNTPFQHGATLTGHALSCAVGLAVLEHIERNNLAKQAARLGDVLEAELNQLSGLPIVGEVRGRGLMRGIELVMNKASRAPFPRSRQVGDQVVGEARRRGLLLVAGKGGVDGVLGDYVMVAPPLTVTEEQIKEIVGILRDALEEVALNEGVQ